MTYTRLWRLPAAPQDLEEVRAQQLPPRNWRLSVLWNDENGELRETFLIFENVASVRVNYRATANVDAIKLAYNEVIDLGQSADLARVQAAWNSEHPGHPQAAPPLRHMIVYFSDHGSYEMFCSGLRVAE